MKNLDYLDLVNLVEATHPCEDGRTWLADSGYDLRTALERCSMPLWIRWFVTRTSLVPVLWRIDITHIYAEWVNACDGLQTWYYMEWITRVQFCMLLDLEREKTLKRMREQLRPLLQDTPHAQLGNIAHLKET